MRGSEGGGGGRGGGGGSKAGDCEKGRITVSLFIDIFASSGFLVLVCLITCVSRETQPRAKADHG